MTVDAPAEAAAAPRRVGIRVPARWRIVGWLVLMLAVSLLAVTLTVRTVMLAEGARSANGSLEREVTEVTDFADIGRDPETAAPFSDLNRFFDVYLARQNPDPGEFMMSVTEGDLGTARLVHGPSRSMPDFATAGVDVLTPGGDVSTLQQVLDGEPSGLLRFRGGSLRYIRVDLTQGGQTGALLLIQFDRPLIAQTDNATRLLIMISAGALVLGGALAWFAAGAILRPVRTVRRAAAEITEYDLTRRIPVQGNDDIADLAVTFNGMLDRLDTAFSLQQRFVDDVSHELRTPITIVRGHIEMLPSTGDSDTTATRALILDELDRMSRIVSDLLTLAKAERPNFVQIERGVDTAELTTDLDAKVAVLGDRRWQLGEIADGTADLDPQRIQQAMLQLAQNAVEHTRSGDLIEVSSAFDDDDELGPVVRFTVRDEGEGIAPENVELIFDRFNRGDSGGHRGPGVGLGLAIVKAIVDGHGGSVTVDSVRGRGATFGLLIPHGSGRARPRDDDFGTLTDQEDRAASSPATPATGRTAPGDPVRSQHTATAGEGTQR